MKIFVINRGSSTIKCYLYDYKKGPVNPSWEAHLEWKNNFDSPKAKIKNDQGTEFPQAVQGKSAGEALSSLIQSLMKGKAAVLSSLDQIDAIGHRIVHGGRFFKESVVIDAKVKEQIRLLSELAPLHNLPELEGIEILEKIFKKTPQIAVFDTAFHHTIPLSSAIYPGPYQWFTEGIQRYGFHGISYQYCSRRIAEMLGKDAQKMVICHLGAGASLCAVKDGRSMDTTMGFTPLEGLMMDTRSGSIDPGIILHFLEKKKKTAKELSKELNQESGLLGISGSSSDMRDIIDQSLKGNPRATLALDIYLHRLTSLIGSMIASLQGIDALIFTAGIGENASLIREKVCKAFSFLGVKLDIEKNGQISSADRIISASDSKVKIVLIHTQEALEIARECWTIISKAKTSS